MTYSTINMISIIGLTLFVLIHKGVEAVTCPTESPAIAAATYDPQSFTATDFTSAAANEVCTFTIVAPGANKYLMIYLESATVETGDKLKVEDEDATVVITEVTGTNFAATGAVALANKAVTVTLTFAGVGTYTSNTFKVRYWKLDSDPSSCSGTSVMQATTTAGYIASNIPTSTTAATCYWYLFSMGKCMTITPMFKDIASGDALTISNSNSDGTDLADMTLGAGPFYTTTLTSTADVVRVKFVKTTTSGNGFQLKYVATATTCSSRCSGASSVVASVLLIAASLLSYAFHRHL